MRIGITQRTLSHNGFDYDSLEPCWYDLFKEHEIIPIPNNVNVTKDLYKDIDLLVLSGGKDLVTRRIVETRLISFMLSKDKPIIGVCHGAFLLTHLFDGTVNYDEEIKEIKEHEVTSDIDRVLVNSYHNLVISEPPKDTAVLYKDGDLIESWVHNYYKIGVMVWHPERMKDPFIPKEILKFING